MVKRDLIGGSYNDARTTYCITDPQTLLDPFRSIGWAALARRTYPLSVTKWISHALRISWSTMCVGEVHVFHLDFYVSYS